MLKEDRTNSDQGKTKNIQNKGERAWTLTVQRRINKRITGKQPGTHSRSFVFSLEWLSCRVTDCNESRYPFLDFRWESVSCQQLAACSPVYKERQGSRSPSVSLFDVSDLRFSRSQERLLEAVRDTAEENGVINFQNYASVQTFTVLFRPGPRHSSGTVWANNLRIRFLQKKSTHPLTQS